MWLDKPPHVEEITQIPLLRAKANRPVRGKLAGAPLRCFIHYAAGRSWPCTGHGCVLCDKKIARRFYAYYPITGATGGIGILELTSLAEHQLIFQMEPYSHEPCGYIEVSRPPGKKNLPCSVKWMEPKTPQDRTRCTLSEKELKNALFRIWKLPAINGQDDESIYIRQLNETIRLQTNS